MVASFRVIVDNYGGEIIESAWGLSILIETPGKNILFDTGPSPKILEENLRTLGIDPGIIDLVVISHEHSDHAFGLKYIAASNPGIDVYVPSYSQEQFLKRFVGQKLNFIGIENNTEICSGVFILGPMYGPPFEQSLALRIEDEGLAIFVGCSHPKIINIAMKACREMGMKPYSVIGGFHMGGASSQECRETVKYLLKFGARKLLPIHCSGENIRLILKKNFKDVWVNYVEGDKIKLPGK